MHEPVFSVPSNKTLNRWKKSHNRRCSHPSLSKMPSTKIVATLGPSTDEPPYLRRMFDAGVDVFRLNTSHGTWEDHLGRIAAVRAMAAELSVHAGILLDLQGPK